MDENFGPKLILYSPWTFVFLVLIIILGNLILIDYALFFPQDNITTNQTTTKPTPFPQLTSVPAQGCLDDCKKEIEKTVQDKINPKPAQQIQESSKEFYVPLGTGSSSSVEWIDVPGVQAYIDSTSYNNIKSVTFEASLYTPTANQEAYARLYNITDSHPVWNSDVFINSTNHELKISSPINLDKGSKLYQVQIKTQLGSRTNLENARVHILTY